MWKLLSSFLLFLLLPILCNEIERASGISKANDAEAAQRFDGSAVLVSKVEGTSKKTRRETRGYAIYRFNSLCSMQSSLLSEPELLANQTAPQHWSKVGGPNTPPS